jgi:hypothetical protein
MTMRNSSSSSGPQRPSRQRLVLATAAATLVSMAGLGCGGGTAAKPSGTGGAGGGGGNAAPGVLDRPCADAMRFGGFELVLVAPTPTAEGYAQLIGTIQDKANPNKIWQAAATDGDCRLMVGTPCTTSCTLPSICDGASCVPGPTTKTVGMVTVTGLNSPLSATPNPQKNYYAPASGFPPAPVGANVVLTAAGGDYAGFSLRGAGFPVIESPSTALPFQMGKPFTATWTPPPAPVASRMIVKVDIAFHGGVDAQIQCDVADNGSVTVPASLVDALLAKGVAGFPTAFLTRRTIDSTDVGGGCVDFAMTTVFNGNTGIQLMIPGITSCNEDMDCPTGMTCGPDLKCK